MKKSRRIARLEAEVATLTKELDACRRERDSYRRELVATNRAVDMLRRNSPSLVDQARSEFRAKWSWLLEAVGL